MVMMSNRMLHSGIWLLAVLCLLFAVVIGTTAWLLPVTVTGQLPRKTLSSVPIKPPVTAPQAVSNLPSLASYDPIWKLQLRPVSQTVSPTASAQPQVSSNAPPAKPFTAKLIGTILEPDHSMALLATRTGDIIFVSIGQMVEDAKVIQIQPQQVILDQNGQTLTLELTEAKTPVNARLTPRRSYNVNSRRPMR